jgi:hypothetical protein
MAGFNRCRFRLEGSGKRLTWLIHKIVTQNTYLSDNIKAQLKNRMENNPGYPGFLNEKIL